MKTLLATIAMFSLSSTAFALGTPRAAKAQMAKHFDTSSANISKVTAIDTTGGKVFQAEILKQIFVPENNGGAIGDQSIAAGTKINAVPQKVGNKVIYNVGVAAFATPN